MLQIQISVFSLTYWTVVQAWAREGEIQEVKPKLFVALMAFLVKQIWDDEKSQMCFNHK